MADSDDHRTMSIVPYNYSREVVLRHNDALVVYDRASQQLQLQDVSQADEELNLPRLCPYCHRPFQEENDSDIGDEHGGRAPTSTGYVDPNYFAMLDSSQAPSANRLGSPGNRLMPYVVDEREEDNSNAARNPLTSAGISPQSFNDGFFKRNFIEERVLGKGGKGVVMLVKHILGNNDLGQFACKRVPVGDSPEWLRKVLVEVQTLKQLSHHNLAPYHHAWLEHAKVSSFGPTVPCVFILQRYCEAGDLHRYVCGPAQTQSSPQELKARLRRKSRGEPEPPSGLAGPRKLQIEAIYSLFKDITNGLRYLHKKNLIHRDLKPSNCLLTMEGNKLHAVVSDFGEVQSEDVVRASTGNTGTVSYCAPEVLQRVGPQGPYGNFTYKSDIFSLGMVLYFLCFATLPYVHADVNDEDNEDLDQLRAEVCQWSGFDDAQRLRPELPDKVYWLLARLLSQSPDKRPSCREIFDLMKKHNNWDIANADRRPPVNPAIEVPQISPIRRDRSDSGSPSSHRGSISPRLEKSTPKWTPELDGPTGSPAATARDYGAWASGSAVGRIGASGDDQSLVLSRKSHSDAYTSDTSDQARFRHQNQAGHDSYDQTRDRPYSRVVGSLYKYPGRDGGQNDEYHYERGPEGHRETDPGGSRYSFASHSDPGQQTSNITTHDRAIGPGPDNNTGFLNSILRRLDVYAHPVMANLPAFAVFLLKLLTITMPCTPYAVRPSIFYQLLVLATIDLGVVSMPFHTIALLTHCLVVGLARKFEALCVDV